MKKFEPSEKKDQVRLGMLRLGELRLNQNSENSKQYMKKFEPPEIGITLVRLGKV